MIIRAQRARLWAVTWIAGMPGVVAAAWLGLPVMVGSGAEQTPLWVLQVATTAQSAVLLAVATGAGAFLANRVQLAAPVLAAIAHGEPVMGRLRPQVVPGFVGGFLGALFLWLFTFITPRALEHSADRFSMPAAVRLLYGGITEELLVRWGFMTVVVWLLCRCFQRGADSPRASLYYTAILISAVAFGVSHLPAAAVMVASVSPDVAFYVIGANASFGLIAGWLYWRYGLESAMLAHVTAHVCLLLAQ